MKTRAQEDMVLAEKLVTEAENKGDNELSKIYGGLCHQFPVMVRTCGLCQALAFSVAKKGSEGARGKAHGLLLQHVAELLGVKEEELLQKVLEADTLTYMLHTKRVLAAWIYFKQFAVSILKVQSAQEAKDE